jgi:uncharacterized protein (TIGR04222 family)
MNPLDMTGPEFLRFYLVYGLCGLALAGLLRILWNRGVAANAELRWTPGYYPQDEEAYGIALLRGGRKEAVRTLLGRLLAEELVVMDRGQIQKTDKSKQSLYGLVPLERQVLETLDTRETPKGAEMLLEGIAAPSLDRIEEDLGRQGLVPPKAARERLQGLCALALFAISGLGILKLIVAVGRGKTNINFLLILLAVYTAAVLVLLLPPRRTAAGRRYLAWLQDSHKGLRDLLASGRREGAGEVALAAGIFGIAALPMLADLSLALEPPRRKEGGGGCGSGCGGGDGGGGGSCGGGGCGGGGCGGCGS